MWGFEINKGLCRDLILHTALAPIKYGPHLTKRP